MDTRKSELVGRSKDWFHSIELNLAEQIETLRCGIEDLSSTVKRLAKEQLPYARSRATDALTDAEEVVKRSPLVVVAIALGLGLLIGVLTRR